MAIDFDGAYALSSVVLPHDEFNYGEDVYELWSVHHVIVLSHMSSARFRNSWQSPPPR